MAVVHVATAHRQHTQMALTHRPGAPSIVWVVTPGGKKPHGGRTHGPSPPLTRTRGTHPRAWAATAPIRTPPRRWGGRAWCAGPTPGGEVGHNV